VTEWIDGEKLAASSKETINRLIPVGIECFLTQLLETGFFHADPHPGNLLVPINVCRVTQISKVSKIDSIRFVMCPLLAPIFQGFFFFAAAINSTNEANKAGGTPH
jgi:hypothetical protein